MSSPAKAPARLRGTPPTPLAATEALMWHAGRLGFRKIEPTEETRRAQLAIVAPAYLARGRAVAPGVIVDAGWYGGHN